MTLTKILMVYVGGIFISAFLLVLFDPNPLDDDDYIAAYPLAMFWPVILPIVIFIEALAAPVKLARKLRVWLKL